MQSTHNLTDCGRAGRIFWSGYEFAGRQPRSLAGRVINAVSKAKIPVNMMPSNLKGREISQTIGQARIANIANGQQTIKSNSQSIIPIKVGMVFDPYTVSNNLDIWAIVNIASIGWSR